MNGAARRLGGSDASLWPIAISAAFGFIKGFLVGGQESVPLMQSSVIGPVLEEAVYRVLPNVAVRGGVPDVVTSSYFALEHVVAENQQYGLSGAGAALRFVDVFAGGMLYSNALKSLGFIGAVAAHSLHNLAVNWGRAAHESFSVNRAAVRPPFGAQRRIKRHR